MSLSDHFLQLEEKRGKENRNSPSSSRNMEEVSDFFQLMNYIIAKKDYYCKKMCTLRNDQSARDNVHSQILSEIRDNGLGYCRSVEEAEVVDVNTSSEESSREKKRGTSKEAVGLERLSSAMIESIMRKENTNDKRLTIDNKSFPFDHERTAAEDARHMASHSSVDRRLDSEKRRLNLESSDRGSLIELDLQAMQLPKKEKRAIIDLLKKLDDS